MMNKELQVFVILVSVLAGIIVIRLLVPYSLSDTKNIVPEIYSPQGKATTDQYLTDILAHNLWDENREALSPANNETGSGQPLSGQPSDGGSLSQPGTVADLPFKLVGVSRGEGSYFAVIESDNRIDRYGPGALLPDGSKLEEVLEYGVRISKSGENERFYLFGKN